MLSTAVFYIACCIAVVCVLYYLLLRPIMRGRIAGPVNPGDLSRQTFCITGSSRGIGFEVGRVLVECGGHVVFAVRDVRSCEKRLLKIMSAEQMKRVEVAYLDLSSFESVRTFANDVFILPKRRLDCLINNAHCSGLSALVVSKDGIELSYQVNHLSHFLLTLLLIPSLRLGRPPNDPTRVGGRIVHVSSRMYRYGSISREVYGVSSRNRTGYNPHRVYADTKLMQILFNRELARRMATNKIAVETNCVHPGGLVRTAGTSSWSWSRGTEFCTTHRYEPLLMAMAGTNVEDATRSVLQLASDAQPTSAPWMSGRYYNTTAEEKILPIGDDSSTAEWLWNTSLELVGLGSTCDRDLFRDYGGKSVLQ